MEEHHYILMAFLYHFKMFICAFTVGFFCSFFIDKWRSVLFCCRKKKNLLNSSRDDIREFFKKKLEHANFKE